MHRLQRIVHILGRFRIAYESVCVTGRTQAVHLLLSKLAADELTQVADELSEADQAAEDDLDATPCDFNSHVVVARGIPTMCEAHPSTLSRPDVATPIGNC